MIISALVFALCIALGVFLFRIALRSRPHASTIQEWNTRRSLVNLEAVALLIDPTEEQYLKSQLPAELFRDIQRKRAALARRCIYQVSTNAALVLHLADTVAAGSDRETAAAARELSHLAIRVRMNAMSAVFWLWLKWLWPAADIRVHLQSRDYRNLVDKMFPWLEQTQNLSSSQSRIAGSVES
jgi:hypothetical protein